LANLDRPSGFQPIGVNRRSRPYTAGGTVYPGDAVALNSSGLVVAAAAGGVILGVAANYAVSTGEVSVYDDPQQLFAVQASADEVNAQTDIGQMYDILATAGDSTYRASRMELDSSTGTSSAAQLQLLGIERRVNNALGANVMCIVRINEHAHGSDAAGV